MLSQTATPTPSTNNQIQRRQLSVATSPDQSHNSVEELSPFLKELKRHEETRLEPPKERVKQKLRKLTHRR